jgi:hypothetical protein
MNSEEACARNDRRNGKAPAKTKDSKSNCAVLKQSLDIKSRKNLVISCDDNQNTHQELPDITGSDGNSVLDDKLTRINNRALGSDAVSREENTTHDKPTSEQVANIANHWGVQPEYGWKKDKQLYPNHATMQNSGERQSCCI